MIVKFENFEKNIINYKNFKLFLFHGSNLGKANDCASSIIRLEKEMHEVEKINIFSDQIKKGELSAIFHESQSPSIFGHTTLLSLFLNNEKINKELISNISNINHDNLIVLIKSDQLSPKSSVRIFFESNEKAISVPCYEENRSEKITYISRRLDDEGIDMTQSEINVLSENLPNQRLEIKNELEKIIILHKSFASTNSVASMLSYISDSLENDQQKFVFSLASKCSKDFVKNYNKFTDFGVEDIKLVSYLLEHLFRLLTVKRKLEEGISIKDSIKKLRPPVFFKNIPIFEKQVSSLSINELETIVKKLFICKKELIGGRWSSRFYLLFNLLLFLNSKLIPRIS